MSKPKDAICKGMSRMMSVGLIAFTLASCSPNAETTVVRNTSTIDSTSQQNSPRTTPADANSSDALKRRLTDVFAFCRNDKADAAADYFVYRGPDKSREWKDTLRAGVPEERAAADDLCRRIKGYLDDSQEQVFGVVKVEKESEGEWHLLEVTFRKGDKTAKALFAFLPIKGQFAIGDID